MSARVPHDRNCLPHLAPEDSTQPSQAQCDSPTPPFLSQDQSSGTVHTLTTRVFLAQDASHGLKARWPPLRDIWYPRWLIGVTLRQYDSAAGVLSYSFASASARLLVYSANCVYVSRAGQSLRVVSALGRFIQPFAASVVPGTYFVFSLCGSIQVYACMVASCSTHFFLSIHVL